MHVKYCYINDYEVCVAVSQFSVWPEASAASSGVVAMHACVLWLWLCGQLASGALTISPSCWPPAGYARSSSPLGRWRWSGCQRGV